MGINSHKIVLPRKKAKISTMRKKLAIWYCMYKSQKYTWWSSLLVWQNHSESHSPLNDTLSHYTQLGTALPSTTPHGYFLARMRWPPATISSLEPTTANGICSCPKAMATFQYYIHISTYMENTCTTICFSLVSQQTYSIYTHWLLFTQHTKGIIFLLWKGNVLETRLARNNLISTLWMLIVSCTRG